MGATAAGGVGCGEGLTAGAAGIAEGVAEVAGAGVVTGDAVGAGWVSTICVASEAAAVASVGGVVAGVGSAADTTGDTVVASPTGVVGCTSGAGCAVTGAGGVGFSVGGVFVCGEIGLLGSMIIHFAYAYIVYIVPSY